MNNDTRQKIIDNNPILEELEARGVRVIGNGKQRTAKCPLHEDKTPSFSINVEEQTWFCHTCKTGGSVIDLYAKCEGISDSEAFKRLAAEQEGPPTQFKPRTQVKVQPMSKETPQEESDAPLGPIVKVYPYQNRFGEEMFQVTRHNPKTFRQRHKGSNGEWIPNRGPAELVLYRLPKILSAKEVIICEGEKDVETLVELGFEATCNSGGAGKWLDSYSESLVGKHVVVCGDNGKQGELHVAMVMTSLTGKAKTLLMMKVPDPFKDITDYLETKGGLEDRKKAFIELRNAAQMLNWGNDLPNQILHEIEPDYTNYVEETRNSPIDLSRWLPAFKSYLRPLIPGDLVTVIAATGVGKTAILQNIAMSMLDIPTLMFEMELSKEAIFERFVGHQQNLQGWEVENLYREGTRMGASGLAGVFGNLLICSLSKMDVYAMETLCKRSELKFGCHPKLVLVDYIQLLNGEGGSRYERFSNIAEGLRKLASTLKCVVVATSQVKRTDSEDPRVSLSDAKESGSIENSSSLVLGAWRTFTDTGIMSDKMFIKVLKNSRGSLSRDIECHWAPTFRITQKQHVF